MRRLTCFLLHSGQPSAQRLLTRVPRLRTFVSSNAVEADDIVVRFGPSRESDPAHARVLNPATAVGRTSSRTTMAKYLRRVGVRFALQGTTDASGSNVRFTRLYNVPLFDMRPLACYRADVDEVWRNKRIQKIPDNFREVSFTDEKVTMRVIHLATRALHALDLDFGLVSIGMTGKGVLYVLDISAAPVIQGRLAELYGLALDEFIERESNPHNPVGPVVLGTDVEVMLRNAAGKMVLASNYFSRRGRVGCDDRSVQFDGKRLPLMELRPEPDANPLQLFNNLKDTMVEATRTINRPKVEWRAGSMPFRPYCTGGHIHFSNIPLSRQLVCVLDQYLGIPAMLVEDPATAALRRPRYGFLGDVRIKDHGGFEYRTPASFVVDPDVTAALLCLAHVIAMHYRDLPVTDIYSLSSQVQFYRGNKEAFYVLAEKNLNHIRHVTTYERYRDYIDPIFQMISAKRTWNEDVDVRRAWGVPLARVVPKREVRKSQSRLSVFG